MSRIGLKFSQMILHTSTSKMMNNLPFLLVVLHKPTLWPSTFKNIELKSNNSCYVLFTCIYLGCSFVLHWPDHQGEWQQCEADCSGPPYSAQGPPCTWEGPPGKLQLLAHPPTRQIQLLAQTQLQCTLSLILLYCTYRTQLNCLEIVVNIHRIPIVNYTGQLFICYLSLFFDFSIRIFRCH